MEDSNQAHSPQSRHDCQGSQHYSSVWNDGAILQNCEIQRCRYPGICQDQSSQLKRVQVLATILRPTSVLPTHTSTQRKTNACSCCPADRHRGRTTRVQPE